MALFRVQATPRTTGGSAAQVVLLPFPAPSTSGNAIVVACLVYDGFVAGTYSGVDTNGNVYTQVLHQRNSAAANGVLFLSCPRITAGATPLQITVSRPTGNSSFEAIAIEVGGVGGGLAVNRSASTSSGGGGTSISTPATAALTADEVFLIAACTVSDQQTFITVEAVSPGWLEELESLSLYAPNSAGGEIDTRIRTGVNGTTQSCSWVDNVSNSWSAGIVAFAATVPVLPTLFITSTATLSSPTVEGGDLFATTAFISASSALTGPSFLYDQDVVGATIAATVLYPPLVDAVEAASIPSSAVVNGPALRIVFRLVASVSTDLGGASSNGGTTPAIDTTGANLLVFSIAWNGQISAYLGGSAVSDSKGNAWLPLTLYGSSNTRQQFFYCLNGNVGAGHTFSVFGPGGGGEPDPTVTVYAFGGAGGYQIESGSSSSAPSSPQASGSVTPRTDSALIVTGLSSTGTGIGGVDNVSPAGFIKTTPSPAVNVQGSTAYYIQPTAAPINPTWTWAGTRARTAISTAVFLSTTPPVMRVSNNYAEVWTTATGISLATNGTFPLAAGNTVLLMVGSLGAPTVAAITDLAGNTYTLVGGFTDLSGYRQSIYICRDALPHAANVVTVTWSSATQYRAVVAIQYRFAGHPSAVDVSVSSTTGIVINSPSGREVTVPTFATVAADEVMVVMPRWGLSNYTYYEDASGRTPTAQTNAPQYPGAYNLRWAELLLSAVRQSWPYSYHQSNTTSTLDGLAVITLRAAPRLLSSTSVVNAPSLLYDQPVVGATRPTSSVLFAPISVGNAASLIQTLAPVTIVATGTVTPFNNFALTQTLASTTVVATGTLTPPPWPTLYRVQGTKAQKGTTLVWSDSYLTLTFNDPPAVGNGLIVVVFADYGNVNPATYIPEMRCGDNFGHLYYTAANPPTNFNRSAKFWYVPLVAATGQPFTITIEARSVSGTITNPGPWLLAAAIEVAGVGSGLGVNQLTRNESPTVANVNTTGVTPPLTVDEAFLVAVALVDEFPQPTNTITIAATTPPWQEEIEEAQLVEIQATAHRVEPGGEIATRTVTGALGTTQSATWIIFNGWNQPSGTFEAAGYTALVAFQANGPAPVVSPVDVSQVAVEVLMPPQPTVPQLSQVAVEALLAYTTPPIASVSQAAVEALRTYNNAPAAQIGQVVVEVLRLFTSGPSTSAAVMAQMSVEVLWQNIVPDGCLLSQIVVEVLCPVASVTPVNTTSATAIPITVPTEVTQDVSATLPAVTVMTAELLDEETDPEEPPLDCAVEITPLNLNPHVPARIRDQIARRNARMREAQRRAARARRADATVDPRAIPTRYFWYSYVAQPGDFFISIWVQHTPSFPSGHFINVYGPDSPTLSIYSSTYGPLSIPVVAGHTYYIKISTNSEQREIKLSIVPMVNLPAPADSPYINSDSDETYGTIIYSPVTGQCIQIRQPIAHGEFIHVMPNGVSLWGGYDGLMHIYDAALVEIATFSLVVGEGSPTSILLSSNRTDKFYLRGGSAGVGRIFTVSQTGVRGPYLTQQAPGGFGISLDERYAYYYHSSGGVGRWDLTTDTAATPLLPEYRCSYNDDQILTLGDGTVILGAYEIDDTDKCGAIRLSPEGVVLNTYPIAETRTAYVNRIAHGADNMSFWLWMQLDDEDGRDRLVHVDAVTGAILHDVETSQFGGMSYDGQFASTNPLARWGHNGSCDMAVLVLPLPSITSVPTLPFEATVTQTVIEVFGDDAEGGGGGPGPGEPGGGGAPGVWHEFLIAGHALKSIDSWYVGGIRQPQASAEGDPSTQAYFLIPGYSAWDTAFPAVATTREGVTTFATTPRVVTRNGYVYSIMWVLEGAHSPLNMVDIIEGKTPLTINVQGIEDIGDGTGSLITKSFDIYKHCMQNWVFGDYRAGPWLPTETFIDGMPMMQESSFTSCHTLSTLRIAGGYVGAGAIGAEGSFISIRDLIRQLNVSFDCDSGLNRFCQFFVSMVDDQGPGLLLPTLTDVEDILQGSLEISDDFSNHFNALWYLYQKDYVGGRNPGWRTQRKFISEEAILNYLEELLMDSQEYWFTRDKATADDIAQRKLLRHKDPPRLVRFALASRGFNVELGDMRNIRHFGGIGVDGWLKQPVRLVRHMGNVQSHRVELEGYDMARLWTGTFILGDETVLPPLWPDADPTQTVYGYLCDETTGKFSNDVAGKRLR